jgi:hypothetical protein
MYVLTHRSEYSSIPLIEFMVRGYVRDRVTTSPRATSPRIDFLDDATP